MKYFFLLLLVLLVIWAIQRNRAAQSKHPSSDTQDRAPSEMITCKHCGIHLPRAEAVLGQQGLYCSSEHRAAAQDHNPS